MGPGISKCICIICAGAKFYQFRNTIFRDWESCWFDIRLKMKLTLYYIQQPADGAEEKEEVKEEEEEVIRSPSVPDPYLWGSWCRHPQGWAHYQASRNGYPERGHELEDYNAHFSARVPGGQGNQPASSGVHQRHNNLQRQVRSPWGSSPWIYPLKMWHNGAWGETFLRLCTFYISVDRVRIQIII